MKENARNRDGNVRDRVNDREKCVCVQVASVNKMVDLLVNSSWVPLGWIVRKSI